jgi:uncharacterized protein YbcV (DUF1398 family)
MERLYPRQRPSGIGEILVNTTVIKECTESSLAGTITFPEVVKRLVGIGTERYIADLVGKRKLYFSADGETHSDGLTFEAPRIAANFDAIGIKNALVDIQQGRIQYKEFLNRIMEAGCTHYEVFLIGRQTVYFGRDGSQIIERFPQLSN